MNIKLQRQIRQVEVTARASGNQHVRSESILLLLCRDFPRTYNCYADVLDHVRVPKDAKREFLWRRRLFIYGPPICDQCGNKDGPAFRGVKVIGSLHKPWPRFCCVRCGNTNDEVLSRRRATSLELYGCEYPSSSPVVRRKIRRTNQRRRGVDNPLQDPNVIAKIRKTNMRWRGVAWATQDPSVRKQLSESHHSEYTLEKRCQTNRNRYGVDHTSHVPRIVRKIVQRLADPKVKARIRATCQRRWGVDNPIQNSIVFSRQRKSCFRTEDFTYNGKTYASLQGYEPHAIAWLVNRGFEVAPSTSLKFKYLCTTTGKVRSYFPDMHVRKNDNYVVEVKSAFTAGLLEGKRGSKFINIEDKARAVINSGRKFVLIVIDHKKNVRAFQGVPAWETIKPLLRGRLFQ